MAQLSIITPSYNQGQFIEATIQSVLPQLSAEDEYIVVDGLSTDTTPDILKKYANKIKIIAEKDHGQTDALNKGFQQAQHEIIGWLNSDDLYTPDTIARVKSIFENNPSIDVVYGNAIFINEYGKKIGRYPVQKKPQALYFDCIFCQPAVFFKRALLEKYAYLNTELHFCMDYEFWLRLLKNNVQFYYLPQTLAMQRLHSDCKTVDKALEANQEVCELYLQYKLPVPLHRLAKLAWLSSKQKIEFFNHFRALAEKYPVSWTAISLLNTAKYLIKRFHYIF